MTERQRKLYWLFKIGGIIISCLLPILAICEKFPLWRAEHGTSHSIGAGIILIMIVLCIIFRRTVFNFIRDRFNLQHAPPLAIWIIMLVAAYILVYIGDFMYDLTTVFWMGLIGCCIGTFLTYISERIRGADEGSDK